MRIGIVGGGWAGMAAAVAACQAGHTVTVFEAARTLGGRARALQSSLPDETPLTLDNGQHILIGAYTETLRLMRLVGLEPETLLLRQPLSLPFPDGTGLQTPAYATHWPAPLDAIAAIATARGWTWGERLSLIRASLGWQLKRFSCAPELSVSQLCKNMAPRVLHELIEPLCVSALNTPADQASAQVFLKVMQDALFGVRGGSHLLLPRTDLSALFPEAAARWITHRGGQVHLGQRVGSLRWQAPHWLVDGQAFDRVVWATSSSNAATALAEYSSDATDSIANALQTWATTAAALRFEAIATVYAWAPRARLPHPMLALRNTATAPAQFVFDRGQLGGPQGLLAFVVSASDGSREAIQTAVLQQASVQLASLGVPVLLPVQTVVEKQATFACTPGLQRPPQAIAPGLLAAGDYVQGPYPATLEGAVRSGWVAGSLL
ncbi:FAD-dependent oxidoreductase [Rhodoferax sp. AJA081-3]|uniref:hydroxysqualene dehydroxylase HpnE n=1 Tax=Rhodoferax sp. AJA081-3 TaxID=2752316 RepID=UPI001ADF4D36|nr:hydroxysqualene dehydroxylase HpnE [Rhodoferax sp. AJA081-3]QTN30504.1 FAD-dependent oxidoreductase [Rhodoferax sp. AJA081-3]